MAVPSLPIQQIGIPMPFRLGRTLAVRSLFTIKLSHKKVLQSII